jgi:hypothetical protein
VTAPLAVHFDIGRITLHGYSAAQRAQFISSLRDRLAALDPGDGGWPAGAPRRAAHLDAGVLRAGAPPEEAAGRVAAALLAAAGLGPAARGAAGRPGGPAARPGAQRPGRMP